MNPKVVAFLIVLFSITVQSCNQSKNQSNENLVTIQIDTQTPGTEISPETIGLSYETKQLLPDENGVHYFRPDNMPLLSMFKTLGVKNLRIGGNSVDAPGIPIPDEKDIRAFFEFAKAADVKVIYSVRLQDGDPKSAQDIARFIHENYKDVLESFAIGNEPSYYKDYDEYVEKWTAIRDAMVKVYPEAVFCGPDENPDAERLKMLVDDFGNPEGRLVQVTQHNYPFGCSYQNFREKDVTKLIPYDIQESIEKMLSSSADTIYEDVWKGMVDAVEGTPLTYRLSETNSYWFSGLKGVSDSYASALWALDYMHWWASHGAAGLNFHTGDNTGGAISLPCRYAAFVTDSSGYEARPLAYGMKLFNLGGTGNTIPVKVSSSNDQNIVAYANIDQHKTIYITLINKEYKRPESLKIKIQLEEASLLNSKVEAIFLKSKDGNIAASSSDVALGNAQIKDDGTWDGKWQSLPESEDSDNLNVTIPSASAVVIKAQVNH